jgi:hypothetical protein
MLLNSEAVAYNATTIAIVLVIGHELGHLSANQSSSYDAADNVIDLGWSHPDKIARIQNQCLSGESLRKRERDADEIGISIARERLPEIARRWPDQGTIAWLVTQAMYQATHLARWNNGWHDSPDVDMPRVFQHNPDGGVVEFNDKDVKDITTGKATSGRTAQEVESAARGFLCEMTETRRGRWDVLMQSGSTHGTLVERLGEVASALRPIQVGHNSPFEKIEAMLGGLSDLTLIRHRAYLRELEGSICTLIKQPLSCSGAAPNHNLNGLIAQAPADGLSDDQSVKVPINFVMKGPYRDIPADPGALTMSIKSIDSQLTSELAIEQGKRMAAVYSALLTQLDDRMREAGGYWVHLWHSDVEVSYNTFAKTYMVMVQLRAVAQVPRGFAWETVPAMREIQTWGRVDDVHVRPWIDSRHEVIIHFFRKETPGDNKGSQRVITSPLRFDQIFDLTAARSGKPNQPAVFFRDLLSFLHTRLQFTFRTSYTLDDRSTEGPFYILLGRLGDNLYLPADWRPLVYSGHARITSDAELRAAVDRIYVDNSRKQNVWAILGGAKK